jgi:putative IMPACT (imprinted ancient) family translation regulator
METLSTEEKSSIEKQEQEFVKVEAIVDKFSVEEGIPLNETISISLLKIAEGVIEWPDLQSLQNIIYQFSHDRWPTVDSTGRVLMIIKQEWNKHENTFEWVIDSVFADPEIYPSR